MAVKLNRSAVTPARRVIEAGKVVRDERDASSEDALAAKDETVWLEKHGWDDFADWYLGIDPKASEQTTGRFSFPMGDDKKPHRCAVISIESRAAQYGHRDIATASKKLLNLIDKSDKKK